MLTCPPALTTLGFLPACPLASSSPQDLATRQEVMEPIADMDGDMVWAADNATLFYVTKDAQER